MSNAAGNYAHVVPTVWNGVRYRSRTEARWAVFFDAIHARFEYEHESYKLSNGEWYLPDFWLSDWKLFVEVKGSEPTHEEKGKAGMLAHGTGHPVLLASGGPSANFHLLSHTGNDSPSAWTWGRVELCRKCDGFNLMHYAEENENSWWGTSYLGSEHTDKCFDYYGGRGLPDEAIARARTERFGIHP